MSEWPAASVAVVNYNTPEQVPGCLDALQALEYPGVEILLVENGTAAERVATLESRYPGVRVLRPESNLGFAGGANLAWQAAGGALLAVVNPDVRVAPGWLQALAAGLRDHADA